MSNFQPTASDFQPTASDSKLANPPTDLYNRAGWNDFINFFC